ncbi:hypothetical protein U1Q18_039623, partial [Sarracenia purpurea var. burkii]
KPSNRYGDVKRHIAYGEKAPKFSVVDEGDHKEKETYDEVDKAEVGIGDTSQQLVPRGGPEELHGDVNPVSEGVDLLHVEHHQSHSRGKVALMEHQRSGAKLDAKNQGLYIWEPPLVGVKIFTVSFCGVADPLSMISKANADIRAVGSTIDVSGYSSPFRSNHM